VGWGWEGCCVSLLKGLGGFVVLVVVVVEGEGAEEEKR
jgi:hypothetical protein